MAAVGSIRAQDAEDLASADYLRKAGDFAVRQSYLSAGTDILGGLAKGLAGMGAGKAPGGKSIGDPTQIGSLY